jgi:nucleoside-diphosphate-sugar epimerase
MKILIIGGSRFVGPILIKKLLANGHTLTIFNRGTQDYGYPDSVTHVKGDRNNGFKIDDHFDTVIDMCAYNGEQTQAALDGLSYDFFLHFGSVASYQESQIFPITEDSPLGVWPAMGDYGKGKVECEEVLAQSGKKYATVRPTYILGVDNYLDRENFIYKKIHESETITFPGSGQGVVTYAFVDDVAEVFAILAEKQIEGEFNCAGDEAITLKGLVEYMASLLGKKAHITNGPQKTREEGLRESFPFGNHNMIFSNQKIKDLGVELTPLLEGLKNDFNNWYKERL